MEYWLHPHIYICTYYFPTTARIHAVEVLKGPSAITQGPSTIGGALNLISTPIPTEGKGKFVQELGDNGMTRSHSCGWREWFIWWHG